MGVVTRSRSMKTKLLAIMSMIGVAGFSAIQAPSQPPPSTVSAGRTSEKATNPEKPGGGHGLVWVNTEAGVYHREDQSVRSCSAAFPRWAALSAPGFNQVHFAARLVVTPE